MTPETEPAQDQKEARFPSFSTENLKGDIVTEQVFAGKSVTMINIWGTYCGPCINEMPALQELNSQLPDSAQILGIIVDVTNCSVRKRQNRIGFHDLDKMTALIR